MEIGMKFRQSRMVTEDVTAASFGEGLMPVLATPYLVAFLEDTAAACVEGELPDTQITLGTAVNIRHLSATPVGMTVTCEAELIEIDRRRLNFAVRAWDETGLVSEGTQERFIVDKARFIEKTYAKLGGRE
ncbi:MAG: thioesterase family protein [Clostridia bacterium]|nr:thioesterase family protein [Clostridia bacterium]